MYLGFKLFPYISLYLIFLKTHLNDYFLFKTKLNFKNLRQSDLKMIYRVHTNCCLSVRKV